ncbi:MAG: hypothetical protein PF569_00375, partial [Candidatus Woesearchaeota archaeon]|nr:hypothetical protein [Candidatus Woesearchaeota archaeon]
MVNKFTEGLEKVGDRYRIYENVTVSKDDLVEVPIKEGTIVETASGSKQLVKSYRMNVWEQINKNKNGRNYDTIFESVLGEKKVTLGLMNHPEGDADGSPKDIWSVQKNPLVENGWLTAQIDLVGDYGQLAEDVLEKGGSICISSSCLGRVSESGQIEKQGFLLERYGDWVLNPSNGFNHYKNEMQESTKEAVTENNTIIVENTNNDKEKLKETITMSDNRLVKLNLKGMIREAEKASSNKEKLALLEEALSFCEDEDLKDIKESVEAKIETISESIQNRATEADVLEESVKEKEKEVSTVKEAVGAKALEVTKLVAITESIKKDFNKNKAILESQTELKEEAESKLVILERDNSDLILKTSILERDLAEALKLKEADKKDDEEEKEMEDEMKDMTKEEKAEY